MNDETTEDDALLERFVETYSQAHERSARYWRQWTSALPALSREVVEGLAKTMAEERGVPLELAQARVAAEKVAGDMGIAWVQAWLAEHDQRQRKREFAASRSLLPMTLRRKK